MMPRNTQLDMAEWNGEKQQYPWKSELYFTLLCNFSSKPKDVAFSLANPITDPKWPSRFISQGNERHSVYMTITVSSGERMASACATTTLHFHFSTLRPTPPHF